MNLEEKEILTRMAAILDSIGTMLIRVENRLIDVQNHIGKSVVVKARAGRGGRLYNMNEAAIFLEIPRAELKRLMKEGVISYKHENGSVYRFWANEIRDEYDKYLKEQDENSRDSSR
jgi:hypothetical protein